MVSVSTNESGVDGASNFHSTVTTGIEWINFNQLDVFDKVIEKCGAEGYKYEETFKVESKCFNFFIRLKPVQDDYSHLFVYAK